MMQVFRSIPRWACAIVLAIGLLVPGARPLVFQSDPITQVGTAFAGEPLSVVTTTQDLAAIAAEIGGDRVKVEPLAKGYQDPHFVDAKPSYLLKLRKADLFVQVGRDLEVGWAPGLLNGARNSRILPGGPGFVDASAGIRVLELGGRVGREMGDVHPLGNPHYWLDPENGLVIAGNIRDGLARIAPADKGHFDALYADFERRLREKLAGWRKKAEEMKLSGAKAVTYHRSWPYFAQAFGLRVINYVEPRPGVPPAPRHIQDLMAQMKSEGVSLLIVEPYFDPKLPAQVAKTTGAALVILPPSVGAAPDAKDYFSLFDAQLAAIRKALSARGSL
jgi:ABC-type Zn uptake system ZnuABC Zn-binding protein ZnuA